MEVSNDEILAAAGEGIYGLDLEGRVTFVNPAATAMTGHSADELLGAPMHELVHHSHEDGIPLARHACSIYAALCDGVVHRVEDEVFWRRDGSSFPVAYTSTPIFRDGAIAGAVVVFEDVTERRRARRALELALEEVERLRSKLEAENVYLHEQIAHAQPARELLGNSPALRGILRQIAQIAKTDSTVLVTGESGTGKELATRAIHEQSARRGKPFVKVNCAAIATQLVESELFGHEKGAFTGATARRIGRFELAHGGTIFLDEVGELPLETQAKLLRVLQEKEVERVGSSRTIRVDVRVVAATNRDLAALVASGRFRLDLYYRLNVVPIELPPLRERPEDIPGLVAAFLRRESRKLGRDLRGLTRESMEALLAYPWPGNVRELENVIERAAILADGPVLRIEPLAAPAPPARPLHELARLPDAPAETLAAHERAHILRVLDRTGWKIAGERGAGAALGLHPNTLRSRMKRLGIERAAARR